MTRRWQGDETGEKVLGRGNSMSKGLRAGVVLGKEAGLLERQKGGQFGEEKGARQCWLAGLERSLNTIHTEGGQVGRPEESF